MLATGVMIRSQGVDLAGELSVPPNATRLVVFVHGSGSGRMSPRNRRVAHALNRAGFATLLFDLLAEAEEGARAAVFDIPLLASRLDGVLSWLANRVDVGSMVVGLFGASTGAAAALTSAAEPGASIGAVVSRGGRPDLAAAALPQVTAPTLLVVGGDDGVVLELNRSAADLLRCEHRLVVVPGATHLFEGPGALEAVSVEAIRWFDEHL